MFLKYRDVETRIATLGTGDYSVIGFENRYGIERKSLDDLVNCLMGSNRDRFEAELARARNHEMFAVVVEAAFTDLTSGTYRSRMNPHAAAQSVIAFQVRYKIPFLFAGHRKAAEYMTYSILKKATDHEMKKVA